MRRVSLLLVFLAFWSVRAADAAPVTTLTAYLDSFYNEEGSIGFMGYMFGGLCPYCTTLEVIGSIGTGPLLSDPATGVYDYGTATLTMSVFSLPYPPVGFVFGTFTTTIDPFRYTVHECDPEDWACLRINEDFVLGPGLFGDEIARFLHVLPETLGGSLQFYFNQYNQPIWVTAPALELRINAVVPEPSTLLLMALGGSTIFLRRWRRRA